MDLTRKISSIFLVCVFALFLSSCKTRTVVEYRDRDVVQYVTQIMHDTLVQHTHDSVFHTIYASGDTVYNTKYVERVKWREKAVVRVDTMWRDSLVTQYKEKRVEKKIIPRWCYASLCVWVIVLIVGIFKIRELWQKKMF